MPPADKKPASRSGPRTTAGKKQMLVIMDQDVIKAVKFAALEDEIPMSHAVEEAVREWLKRRTPRRKP